MRSYVCCCFQVPQLAMKRRVLQEPPTGNRAKQGVPITLAAARRPPGGRRLEGLDRHQPAGAGHGAVARTSASIAATVRLGWASTLNRPFRVKNEETGDQPPSERS